MKFIKVIIALVLLCAFPKVQATHVSGGDMEWEYLGNDSFLITVHVFRNCNGKALGNQPILISSTCGSKNYSTTLVAEGDITPVCDDQCTRCDSKGCTFKYGIQKISLSAIVSVADFKKNNCCWVTASWDECCRDNQFTTGAASTTFYISSKFNVCEATPLKVTWQDNPVSVVCLARDFINSNNHLLSATLSDSVVHSFTESAQNDTTKTPWSSPYSYTNPVYFLGFPNTTLSHPRGLQLDRRKGTLKFRPMKEEHTLITIKASVYRAGKLLGETTREQPISVVRCPENNTPIISGMDCISNNDLDFTKALCVGEKLAFKICISDKDTIDTVSLKYSHNMPGAKVTVLNKGSKRESLSFEWVADSIDSAQHTYTLFVEANDNACPINGRASRVLHFTVSKSDVISISAVEKNCGTQLLIAKGSSFKRFEWTIDNVTIVNSKKSLSSSDSLYYRFKKPGITEVKAKAFRNGRCASLSKKSITVKNNFMWIQPSTADTVRPCIGANFDLGLKALGTTSTPTINWNGVDSSKTFTSIKTFVAADTNRWIHYTADNGNCRIRDSILIQTELGYVDIPEYHLGCEGLDSFKLEPFKHRNSYRDSIASYVWKPSNRKDSVYWAKKEETLILEMKGYNGCTYIDSTTIELKEAKFRIPNDTSICKGEVGVFKATTGSKGTFDWFFGGTNASNSNYAALDQATVKAPIIKPQKTLVWFTDTVGFKNCAFRDSFNINFHPEPFIGLSYPDSVCDGDSFKVETILNNGVWNFQGINSNGKSSWLHTQASEPGGRPYTLTAKGISQYGCTDDAQVLIFVNNKPKVRFTAQDSTFKNWKLNPQNLSSNAAYYRYEWEVGQPPFVQSNAYNPTIRIDSIGTFDLKLRMTHKWNGCSDSVSKSIKVLRRVSVQGTGSVYGLNIYPNPANSILRVEWPKSFGYRIDIYNTAGVLMVSEIANESSSDLDVGSLPEGFYFLHLQNTEYSEVRTFEIGR